MPSWPPATSAELHSLERGCLSTERNGLAGGSHGAGDAESYPRAPRLGMNADPRPQIDKFREAARELGADESEERFRAVVRKLGKAPPARNAPHPKPKRKHQQP